MSGTTYHVEGEHTLLYRQPGMTLYGILAGSVIKGGRDWKDGVCAPAEHDLRPATLKDFDDFRVCHKGHMS